MTGDPDADSVRLSPELQNAKLCSGKKKQISVAKTIRSTFVGAKKEREKMGSK